MCDGFTDEWCVLERCTGKPTPPDMRGDYVSNEAKAIILANNIAAKKGYWSKERIVKRAYPQPVDDFLGEHTPESRKSKRAQDLSIAESAEEVDAWLEQVFANGDISDKEKESLAFISGVALDWNARINHTVHNGLYRDDPPLMKRPHNA